MSKHIGNMLSLVSFLSARLACRHCEATLSLSDRDGQSSGGLVLNTQNGFELSRRSKCAFMSGVSASVAAADKASRRIENVRLPLKIKCLASRLTRRRRHLAAQENATAAPPLQCPGTRTGLSSITCAMFFMMRRISSYSLIASTGSPPERALDLDLLDFRHAPFYWDRVSDDKNVTALFHRQAHCLHHVL